MNGLTEGIWRDPEAVAAMLPGKWRRTTSGAKACCPCHEDTDPSLDITVRDDTLVWRCRVCGDDKQDAIGAELRRLGIALNRREADAHAASKARPQGVRKLVATHYATDANGEQFLCKERYERFDHHGRRVGRDKDFVWKHKIGHNGHAKWGTGTGGQAPPLYRQHDLASRPTEDVHFCEGELKADRLAQMGLLATSLMSRRKDLPDITILRARRVLVHIDNDPSGEEQAETIAVALRAIECCVVPVRYPDCGPKGDVKDFLDRPGNDLEQLLTRCESAETEPTPQMVGKPTEKALPIIKIEGGKLSEIASAAEAILIADSVQIYQRGGMLVRPVADTVTAADGRRTTIAAVRSVTAIYLRDVICRHIRFQKFQERAKRWVDTDPPLAFAETILERAGEWAFPIIDGVITTPTLRPDGTILFDPGYDRATRLLLVEPPFMAPIQESPSRVDALLAVELLESLFVEFPFKDQKAGLSVALSAAITPVVRGAFAVTPAHVARAPTPGSGKTYLFDTASAIATGQPCHAIAAGRTEEETEKRLAACLLAGYPIINIDNVNGELGGDFLCQITERPLVSPRILGRSEQPQIANRTTIYATGNNIRVKGDMTRRAVICELDPLIERPELRTFKSRPVERVLADRGQYIAAAITIVRAYIVAGRPSPPPPFASYEGWSNTVRGALIWLGRADPVKTLAIARSEDPDLQTLSALLAAWTAAFGIGHKNAQTAAQVIAEPNPALREALDAMGIFGKASPSKSLGHWLRGKKGRIVGTHRFECTEEGKHACRWYVV